MRQEKWIPGYEHLYSITPNGVIYSYKIPGKKKELKKIKTNKCYIVNLFDINGKVECKKVYILVAKTFLKNPNNYNTVIHINDKFNDNVKNLRYVSTNHTKKNNYYCLENGKYYSSPAAFIKALGYTLIKGE